MFGITSFPGVSERSRAQASTAASPSTLRLESIGLEVRMTHGPKPRFWTRVHLKKSHEVMTAISKRPPPGD